LQLEDPLILFFDLLVFPEVPAVVLLIFLVWKKLEYYQNSTDAVRKFCLLKILVVQLQAESSVPAFLQAQFQVNMYSQCSYHINFQGLVFPPISERLHDLSLRERPVCSVLTEKVWRFFGLVFVHVLCMKHVLKR